jgi:2-C-methyl-D-erythritol 4-phosphate cytidylyltransferase
MPTDDCSVVFRYLPDTRIRVVEGDTSNIKITYKEDLEFAERMLGGK